MISKQKTNTLTETFEQFMFFKNCTGCANVTTGGYDLSFMLFLRHNNLKGREPVTIITSQFLLDWIEVMKNNGTTIVTINHHLGNMRVFCYWLMDEELIARFRIRLLRCQEPIPKFYTDEEVAKLVAKPSRFKSFIEHRTYVTICFILATGARASTLTNIKISDINFKDGEIVFRHLKNKKRLIMPLSPALSHVLQEYLRTWERQQEDGWLLCRLNETQGTLAALGQSLASYCNERGVTCKGLHALRHSFSRGYIVNGGNPMMLQKLLGHSTMEMTKRYVQLFSDDIKKEYEQFSPLDKTMKVGKVRRA